MGKHKHSKAMGFLHISCVALIHTIPKIWGKWIHRVRKKYGKHTSISMLSVSEIFRLKQKSNQFPKHGKSMGKKQTFQGLGFLKYFGRSRNPDNAQNMGKVNSHSKGKIWENTNISKFRVSGTFCLKQKSMHFPKHGKSGLPLYGKSMGKHKHFKFMGFLNISYEAEIHTIPRTREKWVPIIRENYGKKSNIP